MYSKPKFFKKKYLTFCLINSSIMVPFSSFAQLPDNISSEKLMSLIQAQQKQLEDQGNIIKKQNKFLHQLEMRVTQLSKIKKGNKSQANTTPKPTIISNNQPAKAEKIFIANKNKAKLSIFGQISQLGFNTNDGKINRMYYGTNTVSNTRLHINSKLNVSPDFKMGSRILFGFRTNPSQTLSEFSPSLNTVDTRRAEMFFTSRKWGTVMMGQGETSSDNSAYADFSNTTLAGRATVEEIGGGLYFNGLQTDPKVGQVFNGLDGYSRRVRLRYDSPKYHGLVVSASAIENSQNDVALKYSQKISGTKIAVRAAYLSPRNSSTTSSFARGNVASASASVLFSNGVSLTGAGGKIRASQTSRLSPTYYYLKTGYQWKAFDYGLTALSVDYGKYLNFAQNNDVANTKGLQILQTVKPLNLSVYSAYRQFALKRAASNFKNIQLMLLGALYKF